MRPLISMLLVMMVLCVAAGCQDSLRLAPSEAVQQNAAIAAESASRLAVLVDTREQVSPAMVDLAEATATGAKAAQNYIGLPEDYAPVQATVARLASEDAVQRAQAKIEAGQVADTATIEGSKRPTATDVVEQANTWADVILDNLDVWLPILGFGGLTAYTTMVRAKKNQAIDALKTTVSSIEKTPEIPATFYDRQDAKLTDEQKKLIADLGGTGPGVSTTPTTGTIP